MRINAFRILIMSSIFGVLSIAPSYAQSGGQQFVVNIPFEFSVGGKILPGGQYHVGRSTQSSPEGLMLRKTDGRAGVFLLTREILTQARQKQSKLVFHRYGRQYFLAQIWTSGQTSGRELLKSRQERLFEQEVARQGRAPERIAVTSVRQ